MTRKDIEQFVERLGDQEMYLLFQGLTKMRPHQIPKHPDFLYRLSGEWKGWDEWLGTPPQVTKGKRP